MRKTRKGKLVATALVLATAGVAAWWTMIRMPGKSYSGSFEPLSPSERELESELRRHVTKLAGDIGRRSIEEHAGLVAAADYVSAEFSAAGWSPERQRFTAAFTPCENIEVEARGSDRAHEIVVIGAHYDAVPGTVGANDNGSGTAALLALARRFQGQPTRRTLRFVAFVNEEPPWFQSENMGSLVYARRSRSRGEPIVAMLSLETMGWYSDEPLSQKYPPPLNLFYPNRGNFIGFVSNLSSRDLLRQVVGSFRQNTRFPSEGAALPSGIPGVGWSDHWAFWQAGYPGVMVTDTAPFRYPYYHTTADTPDKLHYDRLARVVEGVRHVIAELVR